MQLRFIISKKKQILKNNRLTQPIDERQDILKYNGRGVDENLKLKSICWEFQNDVSLAEVLGNNRITDSKLMGNKVFLPGFPFAQLQMPYILIMTPRFELRRYGPLTFLPLTSLSVYISVAGSELELH